MPQADIEWAIEEFRARGGMYARFERYFDGDHNLLFATEKFRNAFGNLFQKFALNLCEPVVTATADRLRIQGWDGDNRNDVDPIWRNNHMGRLSNRVHLESIKTGDSYVIVWPNRKGEPMMHMQHAAQMAVRYDDTDDDPDLLELAAKWWLTNDRMVRLNLYYPDHIEKYVSRRALSSGQGIDALMKPDAYVPWRGPDGPSLEEEDPGQSFVRNKYGIVPVFHFANNADLGDYGMSDLTNVLPVQDALNKTVTDMMVNMEFTAFPQRWATGMQVEVDEESGKPINPPFTPGVDRMITGGEQVKFGQFPSNDTAQYVTAKESFMLDVCRITGVPSHFFYLEKSMPSGEALKVAEGRLVSKVIDRSDAFGDQWARVMGLALEMASKVASHEDADVSVVWQPPAPHNPLLDAETKLVLQQVGISQAQALRELGYSDDEIKQMILENVQEQRVAALVAQGPAKPSQPTTEQGFAPGQTPTAFTRNGSPGQASQVAPQQQQGKTPVSGSTGPVTGLKTGTVPATISPVKARGGTGQYVEGDE